MLIGSLIGSTAKTKKIQSTVIPAILWLLLQHNRVSPACGFYWLLLLLACASSFSRAGWISWCSCSHLPPAPSSTLLLQQDGARGRSGRCCRGRVCRAQPCSDGCFTTHLLESGVGDVEATHTSMESLAYVLKIVALETNSPVEEEKLFSSPLPTNLNSYLPFPLLNFVLFTTCS